MTESPTATDAPTPLGDGRHALALERPDTPAALGESVRRRVAEGHALYPQGGATALDYGGVPRRPGVAIDLRGLDLVVDYPAADMTITVQSGLALARLRDVLAAEKQRLPLDVPRADRATIGGVYATNTAGPRRLGLGRPRDLILGVKFVAADGQELKGGGRVVKNVAGYDLPKLLTGSLGTLGIITELTLKVRPRPETTAIVWATFADLHAAEARLEALNTSATRPVAIELLNRPAARRIGGPLGLPEADWVIAVGVEGNAPEVAWQVARLVDDELKGADDRVVRDGSEADPLWAALTESTAAVDVALAFRANVVPSAVAPLAEAIDPGRWAVQAHAGSGIVWGLALAADAEPPAAELDRLRDRAVQAGGNLVLPRCPTAWKAALPVWGHPRADWAIMERIKAALDPAGVLNPGRFVGTI